MVLCNSCHKYPQDPFISLRSPESRLIGKVWQLQSYKINGIDSVSKFKNYNNFPLPLISFLNYKKNVTPQVFGCVGCDDGTRGFFFQNHYKQFVVGFFDPQTSHFNLNMLLFPQQTTAYDIIELYKSTFILSAIINGNHYELIFKRYS